MGKVLLTTLNSKYVHSNLALKYLYLSGSPFCDLELREFTINNSRDYVFNELVMFDCDAVCFSCYIWNIEKTKQLAADLKKARPEVTILFGGPEVSYEAEAFMEASLFVDFLIAGEGEAAFGKWCQAFNGDCSYSEVPGLVYRKEETICANSPAVTMDFAQVSFPYKTFPCEGDKVIYYESSRGCPFNCSYCISSLDKRIRALPVPRVKADINCFIENKVKQVKFLDRTFNWDKERTLDLFQFIMDRDAGVTNFHFEICADLLDEPLFKLLKKAKKGLFQFEIGIQSTNEKTLRAVNRRTNISKVLEHVRRLVKLGNSHIHTDLIAGLPLEDYGSFGRSFDDVYRLGADQLQLGFLKLLKGTEIRRNARAYDYLWMSTAPYQVISNQFISAEQLCRLGQIETILDLYHNRGGFEGSLEFAISKIESPFRFFEGFAEFYFGKGFQHRSHKKEDLYRIFYQFSQFCGGDRQLEALLAADLERTMNFDAVKKFKRKGWTIL